MCIYVQVCTSIPFHFTYLVSYPQMSLIKKNQLLFQYYIEFSSVRRVTEKQAPELLLNIVALIVS